jgi:GDP-L-fucose synthase
VILAAARVDATFANNAYPVDFLYANLAIQNAILKASADADVRKLLFLGSSCIYPKLAPQPIEEAALLTGPLEPTNQWCAIAKIVGILLCDALRLQHRSDSSEKSSALRKPMMSPVASAMPLFIAS